MFERAAARRKIYGVSEAVALLLAGASVLWFSLSNQYGLLMNEKFRWLTVVGAVLLLVMGLIGLAGRHKRAGVNTWIFGLMFLIVLVGRPYLADENMMSPPESPLQAGLWDQIDQARFPQMNLQSLVTTGADAVYREGSSFTTVGMVKRLEDLDAHGSFALMTSVMYCCLADMIAIGIRVPCDSLDTIEDGQWLMISGKLGKEETEIVLPNFRFSRSMMSSIHDTYHLQPDQILSYNRIDQLALLSDQILNGQSSQLFGKILKASGIKELQEEGPFTVFLPVDRALESLEGIDFNEMSSEDMTQFIYSHIVRGKFFSSDLMGCDNLETLNGNRLTIRFNNAKLMIDESRALFKDTEARNGVIHYIYPALSTSNQEQ